MTNPPYVCHADDYPETRGLVPCGDCTACSMNGVWRAGHAAGTAEVAALRATLDVAFRALEAAKEETEGTEAHGIVMSALSLKKPAAATTAEGK